ncbi:MAG TPA: DUF6629 family protein [Chitinophagaceae bacterium]|nr:DUF6629 family protein [Chitinophagaceae bacterium]
MCFSAGASFGAAAVLSIVGAVAIIKARTVPEGMFAAIPFIFSIQQVAEGMLWLSFNNDDIPGRSFFTYVFLVFAIIFWPIWIPLTTCFLEKDETRKKILTIILIFWGNSCCRLCAYHHAISLRGGRLSSSYSL